MNKLTREVVEETAKKHKASAKRNDSDFAWEVDNIYWLRIMGDVGWKIKQRAVDLWHVFHPEHFDDNGGLIICDIELSDVATRTIKRHIENHPELQLEDWGDMPVRIAEPQMKLM